MIKYNITEFKGLIEDDTPLVPQTDGIVPSVSSKMGYLCGTIQFIAYR